MEINFNLKKIIILIVAIAIGVLVLIINHQNNAIEKQNKYIDEQKEIIKQEQIDNSITKKQDSIRYEQLILKKYSDSLEIERKNRDKQLELYKKYTKKQITKHEDLIKILPNATDNIKDSIWRSELNKKDQFIK
jgi:uncharacterized protein YxeA